MKHDESNDLKRLNAVGVRIDHSNKTLKVRTDQVIGIKQLGRIDYLTHYCGWVLIYENPIVVKSVKSNNEDDVTKSNKNKRQQKRNKKQNRELFV